MRIHRLITGLLLAATVASQAQTIVERRGAPRAWGNQIVDNAGKPLQLNGMSFFWNQYSEGSAYYTKGVLNWLVDDWKCNVVRLAMGVSNTGTYKSTNITPMVEAAIAKGVYVIIDWHEEMAVNHVAQSKAFFGLMAQKYGKFPNVIFEIYNEPHNADPDLNPTWDAIAAYADSVIPVIRQYSKNLVIVGTTNFSQGVDEAAAAPLDTAIYGNVAYTLHFYSGTHKAGLRATALSALNQGAPIFVTEWGTTTSDGGQLTGTSKGAIYTAETDTWFTFLNKYKISSCNWSICNKAEGASAIYPTASNEGGWNDTDLTPSGKYVKALLVSQCTKDPNACPFTGTLPPTVTVPGTIDASKYSLGYGVATEPTADGTGRQLTSIDSGDWSGYSLRSTAADTFLVRVKVSAPTAMSTLKFVVGSKSVTIPVHPSGNPETWFWAYSNTRLILPAGEFSGELRASGPGSNLLEIQQIELLHAPAQIPTLPALISADQFTTAPTVTTGILQMPDHPFPLLSRMRNGATVTYSVNSPKAGTYSLLADVASGTNGGTINVTIGGAAVKKGSITVPATGGWLVWQPVSKDFDFSEGLNTITLTAASDTGALLSIASLRIDDGTPVHFRSTASLVGWARSGSDWILSLGETGSYSELELVSAEGRILSHRDVKGMSETRLQIPSTNLPLWVRLKGARSATLAVPPMR